MDISATEFLKTAATTAEHFGFQTVDTHKRNPLCKNCTEKITRTDSAQDRKLDALHGLLTTGLTSYTDARLHALESPVLFYHMEQVPRTGEAVMALQVYGVEKSIAEALLIQTTRSLVQDFGYENHCVRINSLGDRDSSTRYARELTNYLRRRLDDMPPTARELMKEHVFDALMHLVEKGDELAHKSPSPLEYLSDPSRKHFREIVEFLDMSETPYEIDPKLLGHHQCYSDALFAIDLLDEESVTIPDAPLYIRGGRYSNFLQRHTKQEIPAAGAVVVLREKKAPARNPRSLRNTKASIYVVQLGFGPKIKSLMLINELRRAGVTVHQNLPSDSLSTQLRAAEELGVKYSVIIGQKEYVDGTAILRDMIGRSQEHVPMSGLANRLKRTCLTSA